MDDEAFAVSVRKFLKLVGVTSQREIEQAVAAALREKRIAGTETLEVSMTLEMPALELRFKIDGKLNLQ